MSNSKRSTDSINQLPIGPLSESNTKIVHENSDCIVLLQNPYFKKNAILMKFKYFNRKDTSCSVTVHFTFNDQQL